MKDKISTYLRHAATAIPAAGAAMLAQGWVTADEAAAIDGLQSDFLIGLAAVLAAIVVRLVMLVVAKYAPGLQGLLGGESGNTRTGGSGGSLRSIAFFLLPAMAAAASMAGCLLSSSCAAAGSALTGAPIPATAVQRAGHDDATPVLVSSADLSQAEFAAETAERAGEPPPVNGLYNAGRAAKVMREVFTEGSK